jgi:peptide/nickel transport system substrate-binding protein
MLLSACGAPTAAPTEAPAAATEAPAATTAPAATEAPAATTEPTKVPVTRKGGWLDEVVFSVVASESAVTQLQANAIDVYAGGLASADLPTIKSAGLKSVDYNGLYYDIMYNPAEFNDKNTLNPFADRKIREATNMLYDRNYINQEVYAGGGLAKFFAIQTNGPDYADLADVARSLEAKYAYNLDKAKQIISDEMTKLGATAGADGKWMFKDKPVTLIFLIRPDSDGTRKPIGDYVATQLEAVGFTVDRQYKKSSEASPIWLRSEPKEGKWNLYTAAWSSTVISRDDKGQFQQMYLPGSVQASHPFIDNVNADPAYKTLGDDLANGKFSTLAERRDLMIKAMSLSLEDSLQVWLIDGKNYAPYANTVQATGDLAAGLEGAEVWPYTLRFAGKEGGQLKWGEPDLFADPWNPVAGSNWAFDQAAIRATSSGNGDTINDPFTGLVWPLRIQKMEVTVQTGLPVGKTLDWVTLSTADKIDVPADAWADWDAKAQTFIPAGDGKTAKRKTVLYYQPDLFKSVKWHDGSSLSAGDFVMGLIMTFDRAKKESAIYDEANAKPLFDSFMQSFKGVKIASKDPLVIEWYSDNVPQDAELNLPVSWPLNYGYGEAGWDVIAIGNNAEAAGELAWSPDKAGADPKKPIEETSLIGGPSLEVLSKYLDKAIADKYIPYAPTMGQFVTADDAAARYANLKAWYAAHGHYWVGTGPYFLDKVFLTEKSLTLKSFADYPDLADRWSIFGEPKLAEVALDGPGQVKIGDEAVFNISVTFKGAPYANKDIKQVKYLLYNAKGEVVNVGEATAGADGAYTVTLSKDITAKLEAGSNKIEIAVVPLPVSVPTFSSMEFVTAP